MSTADMRAVIRGDGGRFVYVVSALAALNGLLFGFDTGIISGAILFIDTTFELSPLVEGIVVSGRSGRTPPRRRPRRRPPRPSRR